MSLNFKLPNENSVKTGEFGFYFNNDEFIKCGDVWDNNKIEITFQQDEEHKNPEMTFSKGENSFTLCIKPVEEIK